MFVPGNSAAFAGGGMVPGNSSLKDPNRARIIYWDDTANKLAWLIPDDTSVTIIGDVLSAIGGGTIGGAVVGGRPNDILYIDGSGNLAQSDKFQFDGTDQIGGSGMNIWLSPGDVVGFDGYYGGNTIYSTAGDGVYVTGNAIYLNSYNFPGLDGGVIMQGPYGYMNFFNTANGNIAFKGYHNARNDGLLNAAINFTYTDSAGALLCAPTVNVIYPYVTSPLNYNILTTDYYIEMNAAATTATLPSVTFVRIGKPFFIKNTSAGIVTLGISGVGKIFVNSLMNSMNMNPGDTVQVVSNGLNWMVMGQSSKYKNYMCILNQGGVAAPIASSVMNDFNGTTVAWIRTGVGVFTATATAGVFTVGKTVAGCLTTPGGLLQFNAVATSATVITLTTSVLTQGVVAMAAVPTDGLLLNTPFEIRVFIQ